MASQYNNQYIHAFYTVSGNILTTQMYNNTGNLVSSSSADWGANLMTALTTLDNNNTNPYTVGIVDLSSNKVQMDIAFASYYNTFLTTTQQSSIMTYINNTYKEPRTNATTIYTVTVSGGVYNIGGVAQPSITFTSGNLYFFDQSDATNKGNTLVLGTGADTGIVANNVVYNGTAGSINAYTLIDFSGANAAPLGLYYFSQTTPSMGYQPPPYYPDVTGLSSTTITEMTIRQSANLSGTTFVTNFPQLKKVLFEAGSTITVIPSNIFDSCINLTEITLPIGVTTIENEVFLYCPALKNIVFPNGVTTIGDYVCADNYSLTSFTIPATITSIGSGLFNKNNSLLTVDISNLTNLRTIGTNCFANMSMCRTITLPPSITAFTGGGHFRNNGNLTSISFSNNTNTMAFAQTMLQDCVALTSLTIPIGVTSIGLNCFFNCGLSTIDTYRAFSYGSSGLRNDNFVTIRRWNGSVFNVVGTYSGQASL